jgi:hypothetical protein
MKAVSLTKETEKILDLISKEEDNFNFSKFVQECIRDFYNKKNVFANEESIIIEKHRNNAKIKTLLIENQNLDNILIELKQTFEKQKYDEELRAKKEIEKEDYKRKNILSWFKEETKRDMTEEEYTEYNKMMENDVIKTIFDYITFKQTKTI